MRLRSWKVITSRAIDISSNRPVAVSALSATVTAMIPITAALAAEHKTFFGLFDQVEKELPQVQTVTEVREVGLKLENMLRRHSKAEDDLLLMAQSAAPELKNRFARCLQDHQEIHVEYVQLHTTQHSTKAKRLLKEAIRHSRIHFEYEEHIIFPLIEKTVDPQTLTRLSSMWRLDHPSFQSVTSTRAVAD